MTARLIDSPGNLTGKSVHSIKENLLDSALLDVQVLAKD